MRWKQPETIGYAAIDLAGKTDTGLVRATNEDAFLVLGARALPGSCLAVSGVFDGVGGQVHGAEASAAAARHLAELASALSLDRTSSVALRREVNQIMYRLDDELKQETVRRPSLRGMATTGTIALVMKACPDILWLAIVGDSPAFRLRDGQLRKLTEEDTWIRELVSQGVLSAEEAETHPQRNVITQALGSERSIKPHITAHRIESGDRYLLCTDGLTGMVSKATVGSILASKPAADACEGLIDAANHAGGRDNIAVVVMVFA